MKTAIFHCPPNILAAVDTARDKSSDATSRTEATMLDISLPLPYPQTPESCCVHMAFRSPIWPVRSVLIA